MPRTQNSGLAAIFSQSDKPFQLQQGFALLEGALQLLFGIANPVELFSENENTIHSSVDKGIKFLQGITSIEKSLNLFILQK